MRQLFYCEDCGKPFLLREYLKNHICLAKSKPKETEKAEEEKPVTKKEMIGRAKEAGITGADRMSKYELLEALR